MFWDAIGLVIGLVDYIKCQPFEFIVFRIQGLHVILTTCMVESLTPMLNIKWYQLNHDVLMLKVHFQSFA